MSQGNQQKPSQSGAESAKRNEAVTGGAQPLDPEVLLKAWFVRPGLSEDQQNRVKAIKDAGLNLGQVILRGSQRSADQSAALRQLRECVFTACEAVGLEEVGK